MQEFKWRNVLTIAGSAGVAIALLLAVAEMNASTDTQGTSDGQLVTSHDDMLYANTVPLMDNDVQVTECTWAHLAP